MSASLGTNRRADSVPRPAARRRRRTGAQRGTAAAALAGGLLVAGCGSTYSAADGPETKQVRRTSIAIDYASFYAPINDVQRLVRAHAAGKGLRVTFTTDGAGESAQLASLRRLTGSSGGFGVVAVAPFDASPVGPIAAAAAAKDVKIVSYLQPIAHQTAGITVDLNAAATKLVGDTVTSVAGSAGDPHVLVVAPPAVSPVPDPLAGAGRAASTAIVRALGQLAPAGKPQPLPTVTAIGDADTQQLVAAQLKALPSVDTVLTWNDATAIGAAKALGAGGTVGALVAGGVSSPAALRQLRRGNTALEEIVAPRLSDLAHALVDVPAAVLAGQTPTTEQTTVPFSVFTRRAPATRAALADYRG